MLRMETSITPSWLGLEAPRYTSYPTAHHFTPEVNESVYREWLGAIQDKTNISLYMHIPFCKELCWFCGCHTKATRRYEPIANYVQVLLEELALLKQRMGSTGKLAHLHFGGGSPSLLEAADMQAILQAVESTFGHLPSGEQAIELDPRTTTPENIKFYAASGFNRVSIGIQDFNTEVQAAINRVQPYSMVATVIRQLWGAGLDEINCDLIYGLPHQTLDRFRMTLEKTIGFHPSRISLFSYAHVPQIKKHQMMIDASALPSETEKLALYTAAAEMLRSSGYVAIGMDHFARADDPLAIASAGRTLRRNFQGYVTDTTDTLIGIGCSSISQFPQGYAQNSANSGDYRAMVAAGKLPIVRGRALSAEDRIRKAVIDELMCFMSVDLNEIQERFHLPAGHFAAEMQELEKLEYSEIATCQRGRISIITPHRMAVRVIASIFDQYRGAVPGYSKVA